MTQPYRLAIIPLEKLATHKGARPERFSRRLGDGRHALGVVLAGMRLVLGLISLC